MNILITGVSAGLGNGLARAALEGAGNVYGCSRRTPVDLTSEYPDSFVFEAIDLTDGQGGPERVRKLLGGVDSLDCVVLNAGMLPPIADLGETSLETLREAMETNVWANKWLLDTVFEAVPQVRQVVGISSGASVSGSRGWNAYSVSKAALNMLLKLYAAERPETHFTALAPGLVDTAMQEYISDLPGDDRFATVDRLKKARGTERMPDPLTAGRMLLDAVPRLRNFESGSFVDIREI